MESCGFLAASSGVNALTLSSLLIQAGVSERVSAKTACGFWPGSGLVFVGDAVGVTQSSTLKKTHCPLV